MHLIEGSAKPPAQRAMIPVRTALFAGAGAVGLFFLGVLAARATPVAVSMGVSGGATRSALSFVGTLRGITGPQTLTFTFKKNGTAVCTSQPTMMVTPDSDGSFQTEVPLGGCPDGVFDGSDVTLDVAVGSNVVAQGQYLNPVPYALYAQQVGSPNCPVGYAQEMGGPDMGQTPSIVVCKKGADEMVRVGTGRSAFWIDRYEASVWQNADGTGAQYGGGLTSFPATFPNNGQWATVSSNSAPLYALSKVGVTPSICLTWFQAVEACAASGKELPGRQDWQRAAQGTVDPGSSNGALGACVTNASGPRNTGQGTQCVSIWGAQDMVGNVWEWTDEWYASLDDNAMNSPPAVQPWPDASYGSDGTFNIISSALPGNGFNPVVGLPAAALRGGSFRDLAYAGVFALDLAASPTYSCYIEEGFRCMIKQ